MSRKIPALLLALLLLTGCKPPAKPPPPSVGRDDPGAPSSPAPEWADMESAPTTPSSAPAPPSPVYLPNGIPGDFAYSADIGGRFFPETTLDLTARDDYGPLYPYLGRMWYDPYMGTPRPLYGLCTAGGKVVVDPVYAYAERLEGLYLLQKYLPKEGGESGESRRETTFAATDGSWAVTYADCDYPASLMNPFFPYNHDPQTFPVHDGKAWGAIDHAGRLVYPCKEDFPVTFNSGLALFRDQATGLYGYLDGDGAVAIEPAFQEASSFFDGYAIVLPPFSEGGQDRIGAIDPQGDWIVPPEPGQYVDPADADSFWVTRGRDTLLMNARGEVLADYPDQNVFHSGYGWVREPTEDTVLRRGGETITLPHPVWRVFSGDRFLLDLPRDVEQDPTADWAVVDKAGNTLLRRPRPNVDVYELPSGRFRLGGPDERSYWKRGLLDADLSELLPMRYDHIDDFGDYFAVKEGHYGGLVDKNGTWIVKTLLPAE
jgi:hypothetical protein